MAQPNYAIQYLGSFVVAKGEAYTSAEILAIYPLGTVLKIAKISGDNIKEGINVSINGTPAFPTYEGQESYLASGATYVFSKDCVLAVGIYKAIT